MRTLALAFSLALLFVWSLPGTIAMRWLLMLSALVIFSIVLARQDWYRVGRAATLPLALLATLTLWLLGQVAWLAVEPSWSLDEMRGQWLPALLALLLGLMFSAKATQPATLIVLVFSLQAALAVGQALWHWAATGELLTQQVPLTGGKLEMSFVLNLLLAFITVDLFCRCTRRTPLVRLPLTAVLGILVLALVSGLLAGARNGFIGIFFLAVSAFFFFFLDQRHRLGSLRTLAASVAFFAMLTTFLAIAYRADPRWTTLAETAPIAWDIDRYSTWRNAERYPWPKLGNGLGVEPSAYIRIAFIHSGLRLIAENPLGYGYGRNAFAHALRHKYPDVQLGHAHSGWIDLGVAGGVPALLLWATTLGSLMWRGWRAFFVGNNAYGLVLLFIATGYFGRMVLDSVNKDHMLQIFLFLVGSLLMATGSRPEASEG